MKKQLTLTCAGLALVVWNIAVAGEGMVLGVYVYDPASIEPAARPGYSAIRPWWDMDPDWRRWAPRAHLRVFDHLDVCHAISEYAPLKAHARQHPTQVEGRGQTEREGLRGQAPLRNGEGLLLSGLHRGKPMTIRNPTPCRADAPQVKPTVCPSTLLCLSVAI